MKLYNTTDRAVVDFVPLEPGKVSLYCCGPTVYNYAHIGNLRCYVFEDILRRSLGEAGYAVNHVMNVTDVGHLSGDTDEGEDKMLLASKQKGQTPWEIAEFYTKAFFDDSALLNILRPAVVCKATDHIAQMIALIERLEARGMTYLAGGNVYYDTAKFPDYGKMALLDRQEAPALSRVAVDAAKHNPRDFVLWFTNSKFDGQAMIWDSPWGRGYPGWHIECSAMSIHHLGERFDIHCGGIDHVPVHHTNEIAQSEGALGHKWVNYWLHNEFLLMGKDKMSKSAGGFLTLQSLIAQGYDALDYRYLCLGAHYRSPLVFSWESMDSARNARRNLTEKVAEWKAVAAPVLDFSTQPFVDRWQSALFQDLALPQALSVLWGVVKDPVLDVSRKLGLVLAFDRVLGLGLELVAPKPADVVSEAPPRVHELAALRAQARAAKDFAASDALRDELKALGWAVVDTSSGPQLKKL